MLVKFELVILGPAIRNLFTTHNGKKHLQNSALGSTIGLIVRDIHLLKKDYLDF